MVTFAQKSSWVTVRSGEVDSSLLQNHCKSFNAHINRHHDPAPLLVHDRRLYG